MKSKALGIAIIGLVVFLSGCATSSVLVGTPRAPISPDQVKLYITPPNHYDEIALLDASSRGAWAVSRQGKTSAALDRLKDEAAKLGANGIILNQTGSESGPSVGTGGGRIVGSNFYGGGVATAVQHRVVSGVAIYVDSDTETP